MTPNKRLGAVTALAMLAYGCGGSGGGGGDLPALPVVAISCTPAFVHKLGTSQCSASVNGQDLAADSVEWSASAGSIDASGVLTAPRDAGNVTISAAHAPTSGSGSANVVVSGARALTDRPDDFPGYQIHVVYALAADAQDRELDTDGALAVSVEAWTQWFAAQTGGRRLRVDHDDGAIDVTFVRLVRSSEELNAYGAQLRDQIESELVAEGFTDPQKAYLVYYDGGDARTGACGGSPYPPELPGTVAAVYLEALPASAAPCSDYELAGSVNAPGYLEFAGLREVLHLLGYAAECAPNFTESGHVIDSPTDILYDGPQAWSPSAIDANRDDYFEAAIDGCIDLAQSAFLEPLPDPQAFAPPGWPYTTLTALPCAEEATAQSTPGAETAIQFVNATSDLVNVYWLDANGIRQFRRQLEPREGFIEATQTTHPYVVTSATTQCLGVYLGDPVLGRAIITEP